MRGTVQLGHMDHACHPAPAIIEVAGVVGRMQHSSEPAHELHAVEKGSAPLRNRRGRGGASLAHASTRSDLHVREPLDSGTPAQLPQSLHVPRGRGSRRAARAGRFAQGRGRTSKASPNKVLTAKELFKLFYADKEWTEESSVYEHEKMNFSGPEPGITFPCRKLPSYLSLFQRFWTSATLRAICDESNSYASQLDRGQKRRYWSKAKRAEAETREAVVKPKISISVLST